MNTCFQSTSPRRFRQHPPTRNGITLVEILVAIGIIGLLMVLLLPAVQSSREAGRRTQCAYNLRQIMIAQHQYLELHGVFPAFEGRFPYRIADVMGIGRERNRPAVTQLFYCPSDPLEKGGVHFVPSYLANTGLRRHGYRGLGDGFSGGYSRRGELSEEVYITASDITDGLSATAAVSERLAIPKIYIYDVDWNDYPHRWHRLLRVTRTRFSDDDLTAMADDCQFNAGPPRVRQVTLTAYNHILPPNQPSCTNGLPFDIYLNFPITASSEHPQGVNLALADGSVRFVSDSIGRDVWWALGTRNGEEPVSF